jgi:GT2 family glycosyltransferase
MNSDCTLISDLDNMIRFMDGHPEVGAIAPQMKDSDGNIQDTARPYVSLPRYILRQIKRVIGHKTTILNNDMNYNQIQTVDWLIGAFIMTSRKAYEATGGLDDDLFMYAEDLDWCTRIRQQGFEVVYYPMAIIQYKGTRRARNNSKYARIFIQSHIKYWKKFGFFYGYPKRKKIIYSE